MICLIATGAVSATQAQSMQADWPTYGGDAGGQRYSSAAQINRQNVSGLQLAWTYHTHALDSERDGWLSAAFESTPVLFKGLLYFTTPFDDIIALDPLNGKEKWRYRPRLDKLHEGDLITSRGVAIWQGRTSKRSCSARVFVGTNDARLISVDAVTGLPCKDFGQDGIVDLKSGLAGNDREFHVTSAPTVLGNVVIVGSSIPDNQAVDAAKGTVRAYDVLSGKQIWTWDPIPWGSLQKIPTGAGNAWSTIAADPSLDYFYVPTGSASPDYYGGMRPGDNRDADSVVALDGKSGKKIWSFQVVHHNLWDYDVASEPVLFTLHGNIPAIAITTKMGMVFVLDRRTGVPLYPIEERPVPKSDVLGETASLTQPFSTLPSLSPLQMPSGSTPGRDPTEGEFCRSQMERLRYEGIFTPPSQKGSLIFPGALGGVNWGSAAYDPTSGILFANTNRLPYFVQLISKEEYPRPVIRLLRMVYSNRVLTIAILALGLLLLARRRIGKTQFVLFSVLVICAAISWHISIRGYQAPPSATDTMHGAFGQDYSFQSKSPYRLFRHPIVDHHGMPCTPGLWGTITALDLQNGKLVWEQAHGVQQIGTNAGSISLGGVIVTAGGLLFSAGTREPLLRAYDSSTGVELWRGELPVPAQATPMSYQVNGKQFIVISAGGSGLWGTKRGDSLVAFALK